MDDLDAGFLFSRELIVHVNALHAACLALVDVSVSSLLNPLRVLSAISAAET